MKTYLAIAALAATMVAMPAQAQEFTYDMTWGDVEMTGGVGPNNTARGGVVDGEYVSTYADGRTVNGTIHCVGMDQPSSAGIFALHLACDARSETGSVSIAYGCNYLGERGPDTPLACVGMLKGKEGGIAGRDGLITMHWYSASESRGVGHWFE